MINTIYKNFSNILLRWHEFNQRNLPWKSSKSPYLTWLSEILLQQTQIAQGLPYYLKISTAFPTVKHLADADLTKIMKLWEGLGYYSRARNLHHTAKYIAYEKNGVFPDTYDELLKLKGVGAYTAAAIASFSFNLPHAVVDGNVFRVLARIFGVKKPIDTTEGKKYFTSLANQLLDKKKPAEYNQAIMDFGATICTPKQPQCTICPFAKVCIAKKNNTIATLPVKLKKLTKKIRCFNYLVIEYGNKFYLQHRTDKDIWKNLYDFPVIESKKLLTKNQLVKTKQWKKWLKNCNPKIADIATDFKQQLSHQHITAQFHNILIVKPLGKELGYVAVEKKGLKKKAFPKIIRDYLKSISNFKY